MASTASPNALNLIITLNFKEQGWDVGWLHTAFDALVATLTAAQEAPNSQSQLLYLINTYHTNGKNDDWMAHVHMFHSQVSSGTITGVALLQDSAKTFYSQLVNTGKWTKKKASQNASAFAGNHNNPYSHNANTKASNGHADKEWKYNKSLSSNNQYAKNGTTYSWCARRPGHGNKPMRVVHAPGMCQPIGAQNKPTANAVQAGSTNGCTNMKKSSFEKKITTLLQDHV